MVLEGLDTVAIKVFFEGWVNYESARGLLKERLAELGLREWRDYRVKKRLRISRDNLEGDLFLYVELPKSKGYKLVERLEGYCPAVISDIEYL